MSIELLTSVVVLLGAAVILVPVFQALGLGAIPGFLVAGIVLGPSGLALIEDYDQIAHFAELGVVFLLFVIGMEINPSRLWRMRRLVLGLGTFQVLLTGALLTLLVRLLPGLSWKVSLLIGLSLSLSSTAFVLQLLTGRRQLTSEYGSASVAVLLLQDLAVVPLLALVSLLAMPDLTVVEDVFLALGEALMILVLVVLAGKFLLNPLLKYLAKFRLPEVFTASALLLVLGSALAMEYAGLSMAMGGVCRRPADCRFVVPASDHCRDRIVSRPVAGPVLHVDGHGAESRSVHGPASGIRRDGGCAGCGEVHDPVAIVQAVWSDRAGVGGNGAAARAKR